VIFDNQERDLRKPGERWKNAVLFILQKRMPHQKWQQFAENIQNTYFSLCDRFDSMKGRLREELTGQKDLHESLPLPPLGLKESVDAENDREKELPARIAETSPAGVAPALKELLNRILNTRIPPVRIYSDQASDAVAKKFNADALTFGDKILFRAGKYDPRGRTGIALLAHELTHTVRSRMEGENAPGHPVIREPEAEEREALDNEKRVLRYFASPVGHNGVMEPVRPSTGNSSPSDSQVLTTPGSIPKAALSSRDLELPPETNSSISTPLQLSEQDITMIKEEVYRDIMNRIRIEFERGG
jgi:hypothetical protein